MKDYYVYIMTNKWNTTLYVGVTNDIVRRVYEHKGDFIDGFTKRYRLHKLVYFEITTSIESAIAREKEIKGWSRKKKEQLIATVNPEWRELDIT